MNVEKALFLLGSTKDVKHFFSRRIVWLLGFIKMHFCKSMYQPYFLALWLLFLTKSRSLHQMFKTETLLLLITAQRQAWNVMDVGEKKSFFISRNCRVYFQWGIEIYKDCSLMCEDYEVLVVSWTSMLSFTYEETIEKVWVNFT